MHYADQELKKHKIKQNGPGKIFFYQKIVASIQFNVFFPLNDGQFCGSLLLP